MRRVLSLILLLLLLAGCRTRKVENTQHKEVKEAHIIQYKERALLFEKQAQTSVFQLSEQQGYELELESEKDSAGNAKELTYQRIRDGDTEAIRVRNGKVKIRTTASRSKSLRQVDTTFAIINKMREKTDAQKHETQNTKQKYAQSTSLKYIFWILLIVILVYIYWKNKQFRQ